CSHFTKLGTWCQDSLTHQPVVRRWNSFTISIHFPWNPPIVDGNPISHAGALKQPKVTFRISDCNESMDQAQANGVDERRRGLDQRKPIFVVIPLLKRQLASAQALEFLQ